MSIFGGKKAVEIPETLAELEQLLPDLVAQAREEGKASVDLEALRAERNKEVVATVKAVHDRIYGIIGAALDEETAGKIKAIVESGVTPEQYAAIGTKLTIPGQDNKEEKDLKAKILAALNESGPDNPGHDNGKLDLSNLPTEERCKIEWDKNPKLRKEFSSLAAYTAFETNKAAGRVRILSKGGNA